MLKTYLITLLTIIFSTALLANTPLEIDAGKWEIIEKNSPEDMLKAILKKIPDGPNKKMMEQMMRQKLAEQKEKKTFTCYSKEDLKNPQQTIQKHMKSANMKGKCEIKDFKSTKSDMSGKLVCDIESKKMAISFKWKAVNKKEMNGETTIPAFMEGMPAQKMTYTSKWVSAKCN